LGAFAFDMVRSLWSEPRSTIVRLAAHKRSMLLAIIAIVAPAATRATVLLVGRGIRDPHVIVMSGLLLVALVSDWRSRGRPHWVLGCGGLALIASQVTRRFIGGTEAWEVIGRWLIG
jgi:hypothetical protein